MKIYNNKDQRYLLLGSRCKTNNLTSNLFYASGDNKSRSGKDGNKLLTCKGPVTEASLHCISYKLSKPRSQLKVFPTFYKTIK